MDYNELRKSLISFYDKYSELNYGLIQLNYTTFEQAISRFYEIGDINSAETLRRFKKIFGCDNEFFNSADITIVTHFTAKERFFVVTKSNDDAYIIGISMFIGSSNEGNAVVSYSERLNEWNVLFGVNCVIEKHEINNKSCNPIKNIM